MNLPEAISEDMMVSRFTQGLPTRLHLSPLGVQGIFDEAVSRVTLIATEYKLDRESNREVTEERSSSVVGLCAASQGTQLDEKPKERICYYCRKPKHISRWCPDRLVNRARKRKEAEKDERKKGKEQGRLAQEKAGAHKKIKVSRS